MPTFIDLENDDGFCLHSTNLFGNFMILFYFFNIPLRRDKSHLELRRRSVGLKFSSLDNKISGEIRIEAKTQVWQFCKVVLQRGYTNFDC